MDDIDSKQVVEALLEDATAKLPSKKAEIRILPAMGMDLHHDVVLISDRAPLYIGTIGPKHSVWRVIKTAPNVGRLMRTQLHWHEPTKEECAIRMAEVMRPYWKPIIERYGFMDMFESGADVDPKEMVCTSQAMAQFYRQRILDIEAELERLYRAVDNDHSGQPDALIKGEIIDLVSEHRVLKRRLGESEDVVDPKAYASDAPVTYRLGYVYYFDGDENDERYQKLGDYASLKEAYDDAISGNYTSRYATFIEVFYGSHAEGKALAREFLITQDGELVDTATSEPVEIPESLADDIDAEAQKAEKPASDEQAEAGNYQKGHVSLQGLEIAIENAKGSTRSGVNKAGESWKVTMPAHYGYIKGTVGKDKDHLDVYIGDSPGGMLVFVVNQKKEEGGFDEHKIMLGFSSKDEAIAAYDRAFTGDLGPKLRESVVSTTVDKLKDWLKSGNTKKPFENIVDAIVDSLLDDVDPKEFVQREPQFSTVVTGRPTEDGFYIYFPVNAENTRPFFEGGWPTVEEAVQFYRSEVGSLDAAIVCVENGKTSRIMGYDQIVESDDPKELAMSIEPAPRFFGQLKVGQVTYDETGAYNRVEKKEHGYRLANYQDETGKLVYDPGPSTLVYMTQFSPAYAYGRFTHVYPHNAKGALLGEEIVDVKDNSDEALWALVDAEIDRQQGPGTAARAQAEHAQRQQQPAAIAGQRARAEIRRMMGGNEA